MKVLRAFISSYYLANFGVQREVTSREVFKSKSTYNGTPELPIDARGSAYMQGRAKWMAVTQSHRMYFDLVCIVSVIYSIEGMAALKRLKIATLD